MISYYLQVRMILETDSSPNEAKPFRMAKDVYKSCMDVGKIEELGLEPIKEILNDLGGWPVLLGKFNQYFAIFLCKNTYFCPFYQFLGPNATWSGDNGNYIWYKQVYKFREVGYSVDYLIDFSVTTDLKNSSWRILDLDQPGLGMSREYLSKGIQDEDVQVSDTFEKSQFFKWYRLGQPNWEYTKWKFQHYYATCLDFM